MPKTPEEKYQEWLEREEEKFGAGYMERATLDEGTFRQMLRDELSEPAMEGDISGFLRASEYKYQQLPQVGVHVENLEQVIKGQVWGTRPAYRDITTGRFVSRESVDLALELLGLK